MNKTTTIRHPVPVNEPLDPEVIAFRRQFDDRSPLDDIIHEGARRMLQAAIDAEVDALSKHISIAETRPDVVWWLKTEACRPEKF